FESGLVDFSTDLTFSTNLGPAGVFIIGRNPATYHPQWASFGDHTTGNGLMMIINGAEASDQTVWKQTIHVAPNTEYRFGLWAASSYPTNPAHLQFFVDGQAIGTDLVLSSNVGEWQFLSTTWRSGSNIEPTLAIKNFTPFASGNDFVLD